jgi:DNA-binding transcriptional MerR regulator
VRNDVSMRRVLNAREVAELLGVPLYTLRGLVRKGEGPPHLRIRRVYRTLP